MEDADTRPDRPEWDEGRVQRIVGSHVLIGVTRARPDGDSFEQVFGMVKSADPVRGFEIELDGTRKGGVYWLPPHIDAFHPAAPGEYRLRSTGETVVNPDYLATWIVEPPE
jgi:hypothetical protein